MEYDPIDVNDPAAIEFWCNKLTCSKEELIEAIGVCGNSGAEVEAYLR